MNRMTSTKHGFVGEIRTVAKSAVQCWNASVIIQNIEQFVPNATPISVTSMEMHLMDGDALHGPSETGD